MHRLAQLPMTCALPVQADPHTTTKPARAGRRLTDEQVMRLRRDYRNGKASTYVLSQQYGLSQATNHRVITGQAYAHLPLVPRSGRKQPWADPRIRYRGTPPEAELRTLKGMLRDHPDRWALVKMVKTLPVDFTVWSDWGLLAETRVERNGWYGVYVCFPAGQPAMAVA